MQRVTFDELCQKEVISCCDGTRLGFIIDACIDLSNAAIISVTIEQQGGFFNFFRHRTITLPWECIKKIGDDLIITEFSVPPQLPEEKKSLFKSIFGK